MDGSRASRILAEWDAVAGEARRPVAAPRGAVVRSALPGGVLAPAALALVLVVAIALMLRNGPNDPVGGVPGVSASPTASPLVTPTPTPSATPAPVATAEATLESAKPTPKPTAGTCDPANLVARITMWEGAAGNRIATVELTNGGPSCKLASLMRPQLVDGGGSVLIDSSDPKTSDTLTMKTGEKVTALVEDSNYCGPAPTAPVTIRFVTKGGEMIEAAPLSPSDATVPPCNGGGSPSHIQMRPWSS